MQLPKLADRCNVCKAEKPISVIADKVNTDSVCNKCLPDYKFADSLSCYMCGKNVEVGRVAVIDSMMLVTCGVVCQDLVEKMVSLDVIYDTLIKPGEDVDTYLRNPCYVCKKTPAVKEIQSYKKKFGICAQCPDSNLIATEHLDCWACRNPITKDYCHYEMTYETLAFKFIFCGSKCLNIHKKEMAKGLANTEVDKRFACGVCNIPTMKKCAGCSLVYYCSQQCQKKDWSSHKKTCKR